MPPSNAETSLCHIQNIAGIWLVPAGRGSLKQARMKLTCLLAALFHLALAARGLAAPVELLTAQEAAQPDLR